MKKWFFPSTVAVGHVGCGGGWPRMSSLVGAAGTKTEVTVDSEDNVVK